MKVLLLFFAFYFIVAQPLHAEDLAPAEAEMQAPVSGSDFEATQILGSKTESQRPEMQQAQPPAAQDECKDLLPQMENDHRDLEAKYKSLSEGSRIAQDSYLLSFNDMTQVLFQLTEARVEETQKITASRDQLKEALEKFNQGNSAETSKKLQDQYMDLTVRLYSATLDSQRTLDALKTQISQVESTRGQYDSIRQEMDQIDQQKLALEAKLVSLKIKCQPERRYY